jgi:hypothetical protein
MSLWTWALQQANLSKNDDDTINIALEESKTLVIFICFLCHYSLDLMRHHPFVLRHVITSLCLRFLKRSLFQAGLEKESFKVNESLASLKKLFTESSFSFTKQNLRESLRGILSFYVKSH